MYGPGEVGKIQCLKEIFISHFSDINRMLHKTKTLEKGEYLQENINGTFTECFMIMNGKWYAIIQLPCSDSR